MPSQDAYLSSTAKWIAAARARESRRPDRLFNDPYADALAGEAGRAALARSEAASGGENLFLPVRTRYFDDLSMATVAEGRQQIVLLGAGLDTRAYRLPLPAEVRIYELDQAEVLAGKERTLATLDARPQCTVHRVGGDLSGTWVDGLEAAGFQATLPSLWLAEGLFFYLAESTLRRLLGLALERAAPGSLLAADVFGTGLLRQPQMQPYLRWLVAQRRPRPYCTDHPADLLNECGWQTRSLTYPGAPDANYGRWPAPAAPPADPPSPSDRAYFVTARAGSL